MSSLAMTAVSTTTPEDVLVATAVAAAQAEEDASHSIPQGDLADHYIEAKIEAPDIVQPDPSQEVNPVGKLTKPRARKSPGSGAKRSESTKRKFICSFSHYGCDTSLSSKNEWKRHVSIQHLQLGFYRCDVGSCNPDNNPNTPPHKKVYNDFNRKDLFTQHHRRMHKPETGPGSALQQDPNSSDWRAFEQSLEEVRNRCWHEKRKPPARSTCGFCGRTFEGEGSWNERMEHVGGHYSRDLPESRREEREDEDLTNWALLQGIVKEAPNGRHVLVDQPASSVDKPFGQRNIDATMSDAPPISPTNGQGLDGTFLATEEFRRSSFPSAYPPLNGTGRPGSSSDRLEDLINTLINPKKPRMSKRLQWHCDCGLDTSVDFAEDNREDGFAFAALGKISIICKGSQSPLVKTGKTSEYEIIRCNDLHERIARAGKVPTDHGVSRLQTSTEPMTDTTAEDHVSAAA